MRSLNKLIAFAFAFVAGCGTDSAAKRSPEKPVEAAPHSEPHFTDGNGAFVETPLAGTTAVAIRVLFYTGSIDDPRGKEGLTKLTATLMAEGGTKGMSYPDMLKALYPMAADIDVDVSLEQTVFQGDVHGDHLERYLPMLAAVIKEPRLEEADFARVRDDLVNDIEKRLRASDDENLGKEMLESMLYPKEHPYGHFVGGTVAGLRAITIEDVRAHAAKMFGKKRLVIGTGGATTPKVRDLLTAAFAELPEGEPRVASIPSVAKPAKTRVLIAQKPGKAVAISIGFSHSVFRGHPDFAPLALVQSYFGEHRQFHGVLMDQMREKRGLNYGDYAYVEEFQQEGGSRNMLLNIARRRQHFEIWIRPVDPKDAVFAIRTAMYLLHQLVEKGVPDEGVTEIKQFLTGYTRLWEITPSRRVGWSLDDHFYGTQGYLDSYRARLEKLTAAEVNAALKRHLVSSPVNIAIVAPDAEALKQALISGEKSAKVYEAQVDPSVLEMDAAVSTFPLGLADGDVTTVNVDALFAD